MDFSLPWDDPGHDVLEDIRQFKRRGSPMKGIAVVSGGLDSTTMVYQLLKDGHKLDLISFDYGQRHKKELQFAAATAKTLGLKHDIVDLSGLTHLISNSALTSSGDQYNVDELKALYVADNLPIEVPDGHYAEENMKKTVVPNRNMIMLSIGVGIAVNRGAKMVATAVHAGDHFIYPDCRPAFVEAASNAAFIGNEGFSAFDYADEAIRAPYMHYTKADIAYKAIELGVPLHMTWSCYKGGENHCGRCGTCVERLEAISEAIEHINSKYHFDGDKHAPSEVDKTVYDDTEFWKTVVKENTNG